MGREPKLPPEEVELFREAVRDVAVLRHDHAPPPRPRPAPVPRQTRRAAEQVLQEALEGWMDAADLETGDELLYVAPGLQNSLLRQLRRGRFALQGELDLHGLTAPEARVAVWEFLAHARAGGKRCLRIVHGKGHGSHQRRPVLKNKVNLWLRQREDVLAFCSARAADGGTGAVYVLLRSP